MSSSELSIQFVYFRQTVHPSVLFIMHEYYLLGLKISTQILVLSLSYPIRIKNSRRYQIHRMEAGSSNHLHE